jgi:hypothetical protein
MGNTVSRRLRDGKASVLRMVKKGFIGKWTWWRCSWVMSDGDGRAVWCRRRLRYSWIGSDGNRMT